MAEGSGSGRGPGRLAGIGAPTIAAAVVGLLVVVVVVVVVVTGGGSAPGSDGAAPNAVGRDQPIPVVAGPGATYPTTVADGVVVAGRPAPRVLDVWEDPLCPGCGEFERRAAEPVARAVTEGRLQVRYHLVNLLEQMSNPPGYSSAAGNAIMCAAENGAFAAVHTSLYAAQPGERGTGYSTEQLVDLGNRAGAGPGYAACVTSGRHTAQVAANLRAALGDPVLRRENGSFGTPSLVLDGRLQTGSGTELDTLLGG